MKTVFKKILQFVYKQKCFDFICLCIFIMKFIYTFKGYTNFVAQKK